MDLDVMKRHIKALIELIEGTGVSELEVEESGLRIRIRKETSGLVPQQGSTVSAPSAPQSVAKGGEPVPVAEQEGIVVIHSPIVGTFYRAPAPGADPYVEVGEFVKKGQVLCVVEAMKLMNEIESDSDGKVIEILVENGQPVEYGEPLMKIEAAQT